MKLKIPFVFAFLILLSGCAALGIPQADTFNKKTVAANALVESIAGTIATLKPAGKISKEVAQKAQDRAQELATGIDIAVEIHKTDPTSATTKLDTVIAGLNALKAELEARQ